MSKALVKKALELCDDQVVSKKPTKKSNKKVKRTRAPVGLASDEVLFNKKGKKSKTLIETYMANKDKSNLKTNLKYLKKMSKISLNYDQVKAVLARPSQSREAKEAAAKESEKNKSVFTEEDFKNFEKTYFNKK